MKKRIESIDILRGIAMVIMALDHVRDFVHITAGIDDPLNFATTTPFLFFTRWITHFCAPTFIFLSGTSIYLQSLRKTKKELSGFLIKRGLWLIFVEIAIVSFAWMFNPHYEFIPLQVIWAIGICMVFLGLLIRLPYNIILALGLLIVFGHNLLDIPESAPGFTSNFLWDILHHGFFTPYQLLPNHYFIIVYPFLPWLGLMILGYCTGIFFTKKYNEQQRTKIFIKIGLSLIAIFIAVRFINIYGDPHPWAIQKDSLFTFLSFMNVTKYPPSLLYLCILIGPGFLMLAFLEKIKNPFTNILMIYGRVPFFYYILHLYLIHLVAVVLFFMRGHSMNEAVTAGEFPAYFVIPGEGLGLAAVYAVWAFVVIALYPLCKWYDKYKTNHREKWWLSYL
ncbi:MAG: heparan-alpha-glucosaminide N-acetyltransferase domain-containing protein [Ginsengibacter sp.]